MIPKIDNLHEIVAFIENDWAARRLVVVGDVMLDKYVWGEVGRISPEAPVPVVRATRSTTQPGGAANVAMNLAHLGARATVVGFTGGDEDENLLRECLRQNAIDAGFVACQGFPTIAKQRILGGNQQMLRLDTERSGLRSPQDYARLTEQLLAQIAQADAVILSDYAKGALTPEVCQTAIGAARARGIPVLVDPKSSDFARYRGATTVCPNLGELAAAARLDAHELDALLDAGQKMVATFDLQFLTATLSEKGIALLRPGCRSIAPAVARQVFDVSGAGDTVIAVLALCLASGIPAEAAVQLANLAAGIVVGKVGTVPVEKYEMLAALTPEIALDAVNKVVSRAELVRRTALWRAGGERIAFTNGCFDLLHIGHIAVLEQARAFGDRLIVAINSDASVQALKGPSRPIVGENERARVLAALAAVDAVVVFGEPTPLEVIRESRPDVIVKGGDYDESTVVGAPEVRSWGGQVRIVPIVPGYSTTRLIARGAGQED
jgi:D-beta-D-heptose 7-phosphate kinase/D-beta-D-heptose 1-phosphate adenosyltransferase